MTTTRAVAHPDVADWGATADHYPVGKRLVVVGLLLLPALPVAVVGFLFWGFTGLLVSPALVSAALLSWAFVLRPPLRSLDKNGVAPGDAARFRNLLEGLSADVGRPAPTLVIVEAAGANAWVARRRGAGFVAVSTGLFDTYTRTEQEAVAAHCLVRLGHSSIVYSMIAAATGKLAYPHAPEVGRADDVEASALTRYPPALAAAISKAEPTTREAPLAFVSAAACHRDPSERVGSLQDI